jgi:hypothetical protein
MLIIGCDYHPGFQQIAFVETETGECGERRLTHREEAEQFYKALKGQSVRVGMEASGHARWFERLLIGLQFELWIGDAAEIRTKRVRKQKTDRQDAQLLLRLMMEDRLPSDLGSGRRESGSAATAVASASIGAHSEKAALYYCFRRVRNGHGSPESLEGRGHIGDTIRSFLLLLERHPVRPCSCSLLELRLVLPLSRRCHRRSGLVENQERRPTCAVSFLCPLQLDAVRFRQLFQRF